jgi:hypothetical protein
VLREDGTLIPTTQFDLAQRDTGKPAAERSKAYVRRHWKYYDSSLAAAQTGRQPDPDNFLERARSHSLCISGMAFQDAWNIDLQRLRRCCVHVVTAGKKLVPFCAYYMTDIYGRRLVYSGLNSC